jgi:amino acid transporter
MGLAGLLLVGIFSAIDLPFRCPAILYTWVVVLAALTRLCGASAAAELATKIHAEGGAAPERT